MDRSAITPVLRRRLVVGVGAVVSVALFILILGASPELWVDHPDPKASTFRWRLSVALADTAVLLLSITLAYGPVRTLAGAEPAVHLPWRRTLGIAAALVALVHLPLGLSIHGDLTKPWASFLQTRPSLDRPFPFLEGARGLANWLGLSAATGLTLLAAISNRRWMRRLGRVRWKTAQRTIYLVFALVGAHAFYYWRVEQRLLTHRAIVLAVMAAAVALQLVAAIRVRRVRRHT